MDRTRSERVDAGDGELDAYVALPAAGGGPGIVVVHEIFGVNEYVARRARG